jgi:hypothetical protein
VARRGVETWAEPCIGLAIEISVVSPGADEGIGRHGSEIWFSAALGVPERQENEPELVTLNILSTQLNWVLGSNLADST